MIGLHARHSKNVVIYKHLGLLPKIQATWKLADGLVTQMYRSSLGNHRVAAPFCRELQPTKKQHSLKNKHMQQASKKEVI